MHVRCLFLTTNTYGTGQSSPLKGYMKLIEYFDTPEKDDFKRLVDEHILLKGETVEGHWLWDVEAVPNLIGKYSVRLTQDDFSMTLTKYGGGGVVEAYTSVQEDMHFDIQHAEVVTSTIPWEAHTTNPFQLKGPVWSATLNKYIPVVFYTRANVPRKRNGSTKHPKIDYKSFPLVTVLEDRVSYANIGDISLAATFPNNRLYKFFLSELQNTLYTRKIDKLPLQHAIKNFMRPHWGSYLKHVASDIRMVFYCAGFEDPKTVADFCAYMEIPYTHTPNYFMILTGKGNKFLLRGRTVCSMYWPDSSSHYLAQRKNEKIFYCKILNFELERLKREGKTLRESYIMPQENDMTLESLYEEVQERLFVLSL